MSGDGWFKIHRDMFESDIWADVTTFRLFIYLIGKASHQDGFKYRGMILNKGQWIRSYRKLADDLSYKEGRGFKKYSLSTIKRCVNKLIESERVNVNETELGTLFTIVNYAKYQHYDENENETPNGLSDEVRTNAELMQNEDGTNAEQDQELKNLRTKELKRTTTTVENDAFVFYQNNIGMIRPIIQDEILDWVNDLGDELVIESLKRAIASNKANWGYAKAILKSWHEKGIKTVEQADAEAIEFQNQQQSRFRPNKPNEIVPEWFANRNEGSGQVSEQTIEDNSEDKDEIDALLRQYAES